MGWLFFANIAVKGINIVAYVHIADIAALHMLMTFLVTMEMGSPFAMGVGGASALTGGKRRFVEIGAVWHIFRSEDIMIMIMAVGVLICLMVSGSTFSTA